MLFTHLLGMIILIPAHGLRRIGLVPWVFLPKFTELVTPKVTLEELILRQELLHMMIPTLITGKFVKMFALTVLPILVLMELTHLPGTVLLMIPPLNLQFPFRLRGTSLS